MRRFRTHSPPRDLVSSALTSRLQTDLPAWYGAKARLAGPPTFHPRPWSYFFRYPFRTNGDNDRAILVKIRHARGMSLSEAVHSAEMGREARGEYESLARLHGVFGREEHAACFFAVCPLALYDDLNAVVMEEAGLRSLRSLLGSPRILLNGRAQADFKDYLGLAGNWLRVFHRTGGNPAGEGTVFTESSYENARQNFAAIGKFLDVNERSALPALLEKLYEIHGRAITPYRLLHDDFNCANIFVTKDHRICSFDPKNTVGPVYADLARIITDLETCRVQILSNGSALSSSYMQQFRASLLLGYFAAKPVDHALLDLFRLLSLLERWQEAETWFAGASLRARFLYAPAMPLIRKYLLRLLRAQMREFDQAGI